MKEIINHKTSNLFDTGCPVFKKTLFKELGIRDCYVRLDRLIVSKQSVLPKKKLLPSGGKLRSQVSWFPTSSAVLMNSSEVRSTLADYQRKNNIETIIGRKNVLKQRVQSMLGNRANDNGQLNCMDGMKDHNSELHTQFNRPNYGLKPSGNRSLQSKQQQLPNDFEKIFHEFKQRLESKLTRK